MRGSFAPTFPSASIMVGEAAPSGGCCEAGVVVDFFYGGGVALDFYNGGQLISMEVGVGRTT